MLRTTLSVFAAAALLAAAGCGSDNNDNNGSSDQAATPAAAPTTSGGGTTSTDDTTSTEDTTTAGDDDGTADQGSGDAAGSGSSSSLKLAAEASGALKFDRSELTAKAGRVTITMDNPSGTGIPHAVAIEGHGVDEDGQTAEPGGTSTVSANLKPGTYTFYCPVGQHEQAGMKGTLRVQ